MLFLEPEKESLHGRTVLLSPAGKEAGWKGRGLRELSIWQVFPVHWVLPAENPSGDAPEKGNIQKERR